MRLIKFVIGVILSTGSIWLFSAFVNCDLDFIFIACTNINSFSLSWACTLFWPFIIGLYFAADEMIRFVQSPKSLFNKSNKDVENEERKRRGK